MTKRIERAFFAVFLLGFLLGMWIAHILEQSTK